MADELHLSLAALAALQPARLAVNLRSAAERSVRRGHPWVFEDSVVKVSGDPHAGDLAIIYDRKKNKLLAVGLFDPDSVIRIKVIAFNQAARLDEEWFTEKIAVAQTKRAALLQTETDGYRLVFGENDGLPACVIDCYARAAVIKLYSAVWFPYLPLLVRALRARVDLDAVVLRLSRNLQRLPAADRHELADGMVIAGALPDPVVVFREHGLRFAADLVHGHKTGYFLDHRANRHRIGRQAAGKTVLDVFAYAGGFSVHALAGGATAVTSLDISGPALQSSVRNRQLNDLPAVRHHLLEADAFAGLAELGSQRRTFDIVIVDPPAFAKKADEVPRALTAYARLIRLAVPLAAPGGLLLAASCSSRVDPEDFFAAVEGEITAAGRHWASEGRTAHDTDHPVTVPELAYLKTGYYRLG
ncbi:MAG: class I SAM-dependent rRNA methyltransferase [Saprospiraceae bacterium]